MDRPLKIVLAAIEYPTQAFSAGIGTYTQNVARGLAERGHHVHVLTRGSRGDALESCEGFTVEYVTPPRPALPASYTTVQMLGLAARGLASEVRYRRKLAARLHQLVGRDGFDLVEAADYLAEAAWFEPARHPRVPFVVRLHSPMAFLERVERNVPPWVRDLVGRLERLQARRATHLSSPARAASPAFGPALRLQGRPIEVYPNPNRLPEAPPAPEPEGSPMVLFVGRLDSAKGADTLVRAVPAILERVPTASFELVGPDMGAAGGYDGYAGYLGSLLPEAARARVRFAGRVPHDALEAYYRRATVCVFPSRFDLFPYTCLEAMSFGKAIVGSSEGGMRELLDEGRAGLLHAPPDPPDLAHKVTRLLTDATLRHTLAARAAHRVRTVFGYEVALDAAESFYRRAVSELARLGASSP